MADKVNAIIQVRLGSTRLPKKVLLPILGRPLLWHVIERVKGAKLVDQIVLATTDNSQDDEIEDFAKQHHLCLFRGSENDVLDRFYQATKQFPCEILVRITPDDPFKDPRIIDQAVQKILSDENLDYVSNTLPPTFPEGLDVEVVRTRALERAHKEAQKPSEREHVTPYIWNNPRRFNISQIALRTDMSHLRWTVDYPQDYKLAVKIYEELYPKKRIFLMDDILALIEEKPELAIMNSDIPYHEGYLKSLVEDAKMNLKDGE